MSLALCIEHNLIPWLLASFDVKGEVFYLFDHNFVLYIKSF